MNKKDFLKKLKKSLSGLPQKDIEERLNFYSEMIDDRKEDGMTESAAVASIGSVEEVARQIFADCPEVKRNKRSLRVWEIILIIVGFPLWFPLLVALSAVVLSLYIAVWAIVFSLWVVDLALAAGGTVAVFAVIELFSGAGSWAGMALGIALMSAGVSVFLFFGCLYLTKGVLQLTKKMTIGLNHVLKRKV